MRASLVTFFVAAATFLSASQTTTAGFAEMDQKPSGVLRVLSIGVNAYEPPLRQMKFATSDATSVVDTLKHAGTTLYEDVQVTTLLDQAVTKQAVADKLREIGENTTPNDTFVLFMSGHGITLNGKFYYVLPSAHSKDDLSSSGGVSIDNLREWIEHIEAKHKLIIADATQSGSLTQLPDIRGTAVLTASTEDQPAAEGYHEHGLFTSTLLDAFIYADANGDDLIDVFELAAYLKREVPARSMHTWYLLQIPQFEIVGSNFLVSRKLGPSPNPQ